MTDDPAEARPARKKFGEVTITGPKGKVWASAPDAYRPCPAPTLEAYKAADAVTVENAHEALDFLSTRTFFKPEITGTRYQIDMAAEKMRYTEHEKQQFEQALHFIPAIQDKITHSDLHQSEQFGKGKPGETRISVTIHPVEEVCGPLPTPAAPVVAAPPAQSGGKKIR